MSPHPAFSGYRTPRKAKTWADRYPGSSQADGNIQSSDLLSEYKTALGITELRDLTLMRIIGNVQSIEDGAASTPAHGRMQLGLAWANNAISTANVNIFGEGTREMQWIWRGNILYAESGTVVTGRGCATIPPERNSIDIDSRQMRKQPTPQHQLRFYWVTDGADEGTTIDVRFHFQMLLALP